MKKPPYNLYTRAHGDQRIDKICPNCGNEHMFHRETGHQHWRPEGNQTGEIVEIKGAVYIKCSYGNYLRTHLKPMSASMRR